MQIGDVDFAASVISVREKKRAHGRRTMRRVPITSALSAILTDWLKIHPGGSDRFAQAEEVERSKKRSRTTGHLWKERPGATKARRAGVRERERPGILPLTENEAGYHLKRTLACSEWKVVREYHAFRHSFISALCQSEDRPASDRRIGWSPERGAAAAISASLPVRSSRRSQKCVRLRGWPAFLTMPSEPLLLSRPVSRTCPRTAPRDLGAPIFLFISVWNDLGLDVRPDSGLRVTPQSATRSFGPKPQARFPQLFCTLIQVNTSAQVAVTRPAAHAHSGRLRRTGYRSTTLPTPCEPSPAPTHRSSEASNESSGIAPRPTSSLSVPDDATRSSTRRRSTSLDPMKPAPPVTSVRMASVPTGSS